MTTKTLTESCAELDALLFIKVPITLAMMNAEISIRQASLDMRLAKIQMEANRAECERLIALTELTG